MHPHGLGAFRLESCHHHWPPAPAAMLSVYIRGLSLGVPVPPRKAAGVSGRAPCHHVEMEGLIGPPMNGLMYKYMGFTGGPMSPRNRWRYNYPTYNWWLPGPTFDLVKEKIAIPSIIMVQPLVFGGCTVSPKEKPGASLQIMVFFQRFS